MYGSTGSPQGQDPAQAKGEEEVGPKDQPGGQTSDEAPKTEEAVEGEVVEEEKK